MKKFSVFDNNKPASEVGFPRLKGKGWVNHSFDTLAEAQAYAENWLGDWFSGELTVNVPDDYSGYGDMIEIREEEK